MKTLKRLYFCLSWPWLFVYFITSQRSRVVVQDSTGKIALVAGNFQRWYAHTDLGLPGGGIHRGEAASVGAARELAEELGVQLPAEQLTNIGSGRVTQYGLSYRAQFFFVLLPVGVQLVPDGKEVTMLTWHTRQEIGQIATKPDVQLALRLLAEHH